MTHRVNINFLSDSRFPSRNRINQLVDRLPNLCNQLIVATTGTICAAALVCAYISSPWLVAGVIGAVLSSAQFS